MWQQILPGLRIKIFMTVVLGVIYPLAITGICQAESLARYARYVDGAPAKAVLRAWDKRQQAR